MRNSRTYPNLFYWQFSRQSSANSSQVWKRSTKQKKSDEKFERKTKPSFQLMISKAWLTNKEKNLVQNYLCRAKEERQNIFHFQKSEEFSVKRNPSGSSSYIWNNLESGFVFIFTHSISLYLSSSFALCVFWLCTLLDCPHIYLIC